jgi:tetratricopeptide (TPR) repeat protein
LKNNEEKGKVSDQQKEGKAVKEVEETKDPAQEDYEKGKELLEAGDETQAVSYFHNALIGFEQAGNEKGIANASDQIGDICAVRQEHEKALTHFERAQEICTREKDMFSLIALQKKMALSKRALEQFGEAVKIYLNVIDIYAGYNNPAGTVTIMEDLANLYLEMGDRQKSADTFRTISSIHKNFNHSLQAQQFMEKAEQIEKEAE